MKCDWKTKSLFTLSLLAASHAVGASFSYEYFIPSQQGFRSTDWTDTFSVAQFNGDLGQLTGVDIVFGGVVQVSYLVENKGSTATFSWSQQCDMTLTVPGRADPMTIRTTDSGTKTITGGQTESWSAGPFSDDEKLSFSQDSLSPFIGTGFIQMPVTAHATWTFEGGSYAASVNTEARASVVITYQYNPVPEPSVVGLITGLGLLGFTGWRRVKQARKLAC